MSDLNNPNGVVVANKRKKPKMSIDKRKEVASFFMLKSVDGPNGLKPERGTFVNAAKKFDISREHASRLYDQGKLKYESTGKFTLTPQHGGGVTKKYDNDELRDAIRVLPPQKKKSLRSMAAAIGVSHATLGRYKRDADDIDDPIIIPHTNAIKPELTEHHEAARVFYARSRLYKGRYISMYNEVHVDEKWFFLTEKELRMYITPGEVVPDRKTPHKSHILKVMFLCAVARPRFDDDGNCTFDGKIGLWPFLETTVAVRDSPNRPAGTVERHPIKVNTERYRDFMINKVLPAIKTQWPERRGRNGKKVKIQQDGASAHIDEYDRDFLNAVGNWNIKLVTQPARSPDVNILDLGFFRALQTKYWEIGFATNIEELVANVEQAFADYDPMTLDKTWITQSSIMDEIILSSGSNNYEIPHMNKDGIIKRRGRLPRRLTASDKVNELVDQWADEEAEMELECLALKLQEWERDERLAQELELWEGEEEAELDALAELLEEEELKEILEEQEMMMVVEENLTDEDDSDEDIYS